MRTTAEVNLSVRAIKGTLITISSCRSATRTPNVTVTRTNTIFRGPNKDSANLFVTRGQGESFQYYLVVEDIWVTGDQYFLLNCTDGVSSYTKRITVITSGDDSSESYPYFTEMEKPPYTRNVNLSRSDAKIVQLRAEVNACTKNMH